ncbi:MAG: copper amine oxidase N-terminal domain-containing protein [Oscillospiraceae bacterium]|nr:copper amine oxidase N-terminal domain-containing protein [Oscillospiraceae bacterium]
MKNAGRWRKIIGTVLAMLLCLGLVAPAIAANPPTFSVVSNNPQWGTVEYDSFLDSEGRLTKTAFAAVYDPSDRYVFDRWEVSGDARIVSQNAIRLDGEIRLTMPETGHVEVRAIFREMVNPGRITIGPSNPDWAVAVALDIAWASGPISGWAEAGERIDLYAFTMNSYELREWSVRAGGVTINDPIWEHFDIPYDTLWEYRAWFTMPSPAVDVDIVAVLAERAAQVTPEPPPRNEESTQPDQALFVTINGRQMEFEVPPYLIENRVFVPFRAIFQELGATVNWNPYMQTATGERDEITVTLMIGSNIVFINGVSEEIDVPARIINGRILVPTRVVAESFGAEVTWDAASRTVNITAG